MLIKSYVLPLTNAERLWMNEVYQLQLKAIVVDQRFIWSKLYDKIPDFDPKSVDPKLLFNAERLSILGIVALEQHEGFLDKFDCIIKAIKKLILEYNQQDHILADSVRQQIGLTLQDIHIAVTCGFDIGPFSTGWAKKEDSPFISAIGINQNMAVFDNYMKYPGVRSLLNRKYDLVTEQQNKLSEHYMPDGKHPIIRDGEHLVELLKNFYAPWYAFDMLQFHELIHGQWSVDMAQLQLASINQFIEGAKNSSFEEAMERFAELPFGKKDEKAYIYYRWIHDLYQSSPIWKNALIANGKAYDHLSIGEHVELISVVAKYVIYKEELEKFIAAEKMKTTIIAGDLSYRGVAILHHLLEVYEKDSTKKISKTNVEKIAVEYKMKSARQLLKVVEELRKDHYVFTGHYNRHQVVYTQYLLIQPILLKLKADKALKELQTRIHLLQQQFPQLLEK